MPTIAVEGEGALDDVALEPAVEEIGSALGEEVEEELLVGEIEPQHALADARALQQLEHAATGIGGRAQNEIAQHVGGPRDRRLVGGKALGVAGGELRDRGLALGEAAAHQQEARGIDRPEVRSRALDDSEAVPGELEIGDDLGIEQAHGVGGDRVAKAGMELLRHRRAADDVVTLQHERVEPGAGR